MKSFYEFCSLKEQQVNQQNLNQTNQVDNKPGQTAVQQNNQNNQNKNNQVMNSQQQIKNQQSNQNQQKPAVDVNQLNNTIAQLKKILLPLGVKF